MVGRHVEVAENCLSRRAAHPRSNMERTVDPNNANAGGRGRGGAGRGPAPADGKMRCRKLRAPVDNFLVDNHAAVRINDGGRRVRIDRRAASNYYDLTRVVPTLIMRNEDYGRIIASSTKINCRSRLKINIENKVYPEGKLPTTQSEKFPARIRLTKS